MLMLSKLRRWIMWRLFSYRLRRQDRINKDFDEIYGTDTASEIRLEAAGVPSAIAERGRALYRPFWESDFRNALSSIRVDYKDWTFIDVGSGKGKLLFLASNYPFKSIIGVEYAPLLHDICEKNCTIYRSVGQKCSNIRPILCDALDFRIPTGPVLCFIGNALDPPTMKAVLKNIEEEVLREPRPILVIYASLRTIAESGDALRHLRSLRMIKRTRRFAVLGNA